MSKKTIKNLILTIATAVALVVVIVSMSYAWFVVKVESPYLFSIDADGVLYVYVGSTTSQSETPFVPAVAMPGAIQAGLPYDVLTAYDAGSASPSYIEKAAQKVHAIGAMTIYNEGYAYEKIPLRKFDSNNPDDVALYPGNAENLDGATVYPRIDSAGKIIWKDANDHSKGWQETIYFEDGSSDPERINSSAVEEYRPLLDENDEIVWKITYTPVYNVDTSTYYCGSFGSFYWECEQRVAEGSSVAVVSYSVAFKASNTPDIVDDYYPDDAVTIDRLYFSNDNRVLADGAIYGVGNTAKTCFDVINNGFDGKFYLYGSEDIFVHADMHLTYPDELLDPRFRGKSIYLVISVSVSVATIQGEDEG